MSRSGSNFRAKTLRHLLWPLVAACCLGQQCATTPPTDVGILPPNVQPQPKVTISTTLGDIVVELFPEQAPKAVANFLQYTREGFYHDTIFHAANANAIAGGAYKANLRAKLVHDPIPNESNNGLLNLRGRIAVLEPTDIGSGTSQFLINLTDNSSVDFELATGRKGQTVFGRIVEGMAVADAIGALKTRSASAEDGTTLPALPENPPVINTAAVIGETPSPIIPNDHPPVAKAGKDHKTAAGVTVTLNGLGSTDSDVNDELTFAWTQTAGTTVTLSDASASRPHFVAPAGPAHLEFSLLVSDLTGLASSDAVSVDVVETPHVRLSTAKGDIVFEMLVDGAPLTTTNFMQYVEDGFYDGLIFHRVISGFVIQGGGFLPDLSQPDGLRDPIVSEFGVDRSNVRGTVAIALSSSPTTGDTDPDSGTSQFFVNLVDNSASLDAQGFTVFANVFAGMDIVDQIAGVATGSMIDANDNQFDDVPVDPIIINAATVE